MFKRVITRKATGPDGLSGRILKTCSEQLAVIFGKRFNWSTVASKVPLLWETSTVCSVPTRGNPKKKKKKNYQWLSPSSSNIRSHEILCFLQIFALGLFLKTLMSSLYIRSKRSKAALTLIDESLLTLLNSLAQSLQSFSL